MKNLYFLFAALSAMLIQSSCKYDEPDTPELPDASVIVSLSHKFGNNDLELSGRYFVTANNDSIQPETLIYHINNFAFITEKDQEVTPSVLYYMVNTSNSLTPSFNMGRLKDLTIKRVRFTIGVADSATNADGLLNDLFPDPMYVSSDAGYINLKLEANSPNIPVTNKLIYHLGGYKGGYLIHHTFEIDLGTYELRSEIGHNHLNLTMDLAELFKDPNIIDVGQYDSILIPNDKARTLAENFATMFKVTSVN